MLIGVYTVIRLNTVIIHFCMDTIFLGQSCAVMNHVIKHFLVYLHGWGLVYMVSALDPSSPVTKRLWYI